MFTLKKRKQPELAEVQDQPSIISETETNLPVHYERINFLHEFKNNGYVKRVLCLYENGGRDVEYYTDRKTTDIPCVDNEVFILADYNHPASTYKLIQTDFSLPLKYKVLQVATGNHLGHHKNELFTYIKEHQLVEIKDGREVVKKPQIGPGYGDIFIEIVDELNKLEGNEILYKMEELLDLIVKNKHLSPLFVKAIEDCPEMKDTDVFRVRSRSTTYLHRIFDNGKLDVLSIHEVFLIGKEHQKNYYFNI